MFLTLKPCRCCGGSRFRRLEKQAEVDPFFARYGLQLTVEHTAILPVLDWALSRRVEKLPHSMRRSGQKLLASIRQRNLLTSLSLKIPYGLCDDCLFLAPWFEITDDQLRDYYSHYLSTAYKNARTDFQPNYAELGKLMGSEQEADSRREQHESYIMPILTHYMEQRDLKRMSLLDYGGGEGGIQPRSDRIDTYVHEVGDEVANAVEQRRFDCVQCLHVLEHVGHPLRTCRDAFDRCLPDGLLYIEVPIEFPGVESITEKNLPICHEHINKFCLQSVRGMLEGLGGEVVVVETGEVDFLHLNGLTPVIRGVVRKRSSPAHNSDKALQGS
jgi:hypothetical protein